MLGKGSEHGETREEANELSECEHQSQTESHQKPVCGVWVGVLVRWLPWRPCSITIHKKSPFSKAMNGTCSWLWLIFYKHTQFCSGMGISVHTHYTLELIHSQTFNLNPYNMLLPIIMGAYFPYRDTEADPGVGNPGLILPPLHST